MTQHPTIRTFLRRIVCLLAAEVSCLLCAAQQQPFPYSVSIDTVVGDCFNNCQAVVSLYDAQGNLISTNDSLHHPIDSIAYPISNLQYHYKNQLYNSIFYSNNHTLTMDVGTYDIGVSGYVMVPYGSGQIPVLVDTTLYGIVLASTYVPMSVSMLAMIAPSDQMGHERCGNRHALPCGDNGRVQMKITSGKFPYTVVFTNAQNDTIRHVVFNQPQHSGNDSLYADYKDYYTFDSLPPGSYRIEVHDACSYTIVLHHTVQLNNVHINFLQNYQNNCSDSNTVKFRAGFTFTMGAYNYDNLYLETIFQYRFIHTDASGHSDTTAWRPINGSQVTSSNYSIYCDTLGFAHRYCDLYGHTIRFEMRDLCSQDTDFVTVTISPPQIPCYSAQDSNVLCLGPQSLDTCALICDSMLNYTQQYRIWTSSNYSFYTCPPRWVYTDSATGQVIKTDPVSSISSSSALTSTEVENIYGPYSNLALPIVRTLVDAQGCVLASRFDTLVFVRDTTIAESPFSWGIISHFNSCNGMSSITVAEDPTPFPSHRDSVIVRLIESPMYDIYNFTATYANGAWTVVKDDSVNNDATIVAQGMSVTIRKVHLPGGLYIFTCETACGVDTFRFNYIGTYYETYDWIEDPAYQTWQECNDLLVKPVSGKYRRSTYHINAQVSNDEPIVTTYDYIPSITLLSGVVGGYSNTSTSMNVPFRFTIPGDYTIRMSFSGCGETFYHTDTIHFVRVRVDFEKAYAVVCDSNSNTGTVIAKAVQGSMPYTYKVYSQPDMHGSLLGTSESGLFYHVPMHLGQEMSVYVIDSCENSYYINTVAMSIEQSQLLWFEGGAPDPGLCVGDTVTLSALPFNEFITYSWHGPANFTATDEHVSFYAADTSSEGWIVVELLNTGCPMPVKDSVYLNVLYSPQVFVSAMAMVCAGDTVEVVITALGNDTVFFNLHRDYAGEHTSQLLSLSPQDTLSIPFPIEAENAFWIGSASDLYCPSNQQQDTVQVSTYPVAAGTLATTVCQSEERLSYPPFAEIDISDTGILQIDTILTSIMGCDSSVTLTVHVLPVKSTILDTTICEGLELSMGSSRYTEEGTYLCGFTADNGCDSVVTLHLGIIGNTATIISSEEDFCERYSTILTLQDAGDSCIWNTGEHTPSIEVSKPGIYYATNYYKGCEATAKYVIPTCQWELYLPNAITPRNADGLNDVFCLSEEQKYWIEDFELYVFNRWGEIAYSSLDKNFKWDGTVNGQIYPNNVYNYIIRLTDKVGRRLSYYGSVVVLL